MRIAKNLRIEMINKEATMPRRSTEKSAGYDVFSEEEIILPAGETKEIPLSFRFAGQFDGMHCVKFYVRSSYGFKKNCLLLHNGKKEHHGVRVDLDAPSHTVTLFNNGDKDLIIPKGEHFIQFIVTRITDDLEPFFVGFVKQTESAKHLLMPTLWHMDERGSYVLTLNEDVSFAPFEKKQFATGIKASLSPDTWLEIKPSKDVKGRVMLANQVAIGDEDYFENEGNDGHYHLAFVNVTDAPLTLPKGTPLAQWRSYPYYVFENEKQQNERRKGGIGHTTNPHKR